MTLINLSKIKTSQDVLRQLNLLDEQFKHGPLQNLATFNLAYRIVTQTIGQHLEQAYFGDPRFVDKLSVLFASYYFEAINQYLAGASPPLPWAKLILSPGMPPSINLLLGANAHINHDLPLAIVASKQEDLAALEADYRKFDDLLRLSAQKILVAYDEPSQPLKFIKDHTRWLYLRPVIWLIRHWRTQALRNARALNLSDKSQRHVIYSARVADRLVLMGRWLSLFR